MNSITALQRTSPERLASRDDGVYIALSDAMPAATLSASRELAADA